MTLPTIPDNLYRLLILIGLFCIAYSYIDDNHNDDMYFSQANFYNREVDSLNIEVMKIVHQKKRLLNVADFLSKRNNIPNPIKSHDSIMIFKQIIRGEKKLVSVSDSIAALWDEYKEGEFNIELFKTQIVNKKEALKQMEEKHDARDENNTLIFIIGSFCLASGLAGMMWFQDVQDKLLKSQLFDKPKIYKYCQSCGKKFSSIRTTSKNSDGTINTAFCKFCFSEGHFTEPELTKEQFLERTEIEVKKIKGGLKRKLVLNRLGDLDRWNDDVYF